MLCGHLSLLTFLLFPLGSQHSVCLLKWLLCTWSEKAVISPKKTRGWSRETWALILLLYSLTSHKPPP